MSADIAPKRAHQALAYLRAIQEGGVSITESELRAYAASPFPKKRSAMALESVFEMLTVEEEIVDYLLRCRWIALVDRSGDPGTRRISMTSLGRAVLSHLDREDVEAEPSETILLNDQDPYGYARVIGKIAEAGDCLIVDPYFRLDQFADIVRLTGASRVLTSSRLAKSDIAALSVALRSVPGDRNVSLRVSSDSMLHDRFLVPASGSVVFLGTSLNSAGRKLSAIGEVHGEVADRIRSTCERFWNEATPLEPTDSKSENPTN
jgi:hypothetical protein